MKKAIVVVLRCIQFIVTLYGVCGAFLLLPFAVLASHVWPLAGVLCAVGALTAGWVLLIEGTLQDEADYAICA